MFSFKMEFVLGLWGMISLILIAAMLIIIYIDRGFDPMLHIPGIILAVITCIDFSSRNKRN